jgi:hypothetical protein
MSDEPNKPGDLRDPDLCNPGWVRPDNWFYEEDWDSPAWRRRIAENRRKIQEFIDEFGFTKCPECGTGHTAKTLCCRNCEFTIARKA